MLIYRKFWVETVRSIDPSVLRWPERGEAGDERNLGCNRSYVDLRGLTWRDAQHAFDLEGELISRVESASNAAEECEKIDDELYEDDEGLYGLDIGVASVVAALSAAGCVTCSSCNGGAYGGVHHEQYPVIAFFAKARHVDLLLECAEEAQIGLEADEEGTLVAYANDIRDMRAFAQSVNARKRQFRLVAGGSRKAEGDELSRIQGSQLELLLE